MSVATIILVGGGGHCKAGIDLIISTGLYKIAGIVDAKEKVGQEVLGFPVIGSDEELDTLKKKCDCFAITVGQIKSPVPRMRVYEHLRSLQAVLPAIISPHAYVSSLATIAEGTMVFHHALVNASASVGVNCIINNKALIEHDAVVGAHCHISTAAVLNGTVKIGDGSFIGSNATIRQGITIGDNCTVGAGSVVVTDVSSQQVVAGVPAIAIGNNA